MLPAVHIMSAKEVTQEDIEGDQDRATSIAHAGDRSCPSPQEAET